MRSIWAKRVLLLVGSTLLCLAALEIAVRFIEPQRVVRSFFEAPDPVLHHRFIPNGHGRYKQAEFDVSYSINSLGLRDVDMPREKPPGVRRILMLGDSFTEGNGVEAADAFPAKLQALLDRGDPGDRWRVINAGVGSYSPLLEYLYLVHEGLALQPDLVILNLDLSDFHDDIQYTQLARFDARGIPVGVGPEPEGEKTWVLKALVRIKDFIRWHTRLYNFVRRRVPGGTGKVTPGDIRSDKYAMLRDSRVSPDDRDWTLTYRYLTLIRDLLEARRIDFWVTVYPYALQVSPREWNRGRGFWGFQPGRVYSAEPQSYVERFCRKNGITVVNTTEDFRRAAQDQYPLYFDLDGHWLPSGHAVMAAALHRSLVSYIRKHDARSAGTTAGSP